MADSKATVRPGQEKGKKKARGFELSKWAKAGAEKRVSVPGMPDQLPRLRAMPRAPGDTTWIGAIPPYGPRDVGAGGVWDFDCAGGEVPCPVEDGYQEYLRNHYPQGPLPYMPQSQGWTSEDLLAQKGVYWHAEDFAEPEFACSGLPLKGTHSAWCGVVASEPGQCFSSAPGYGHNWNQWLCRTVTLPRSGPELSYSFSCDLEEDFDYAYVIIDEELPETCGEVGESADTLAVYTGKRSAYERIILGGPFVRETRFWSRRPFVDYRGATVKICFVVATDCCHDDEDGSYDSCDGAFAVDHVWFNERMKLPTGYGFDSGTLEGWFACGGGTPGDYVAVRDRGSFVNNLPCGFDCCDLEGCVLTFYNPDIAGDYGNGGHFAGHMHKRAWSPVVDLTPYPPRSYCIRSDIYTDLPIPNWIFIKFYAMYSPSPACPTGGWSQPVSDVWVYYSEGPDCREWLKDLSSFVPATAESMKIGISVWNLCEMWQMQCTSGNESPIVDNVQLGVVE
jgi:hypothetical protein